MKSRSTRSDGSWNANKRSSSVVGGVLILGAAASAIWMHGQIAVRNQGYVPFSEPPINYRSDELSDPVAKLQQRLNDGQAKLVYEPEHGYLRSVLKELRIPIDSQMLVFSKTSFQYKKISPEHPRALYFNDDVYIGQVHDGKAIEVVSFDPVQGAIFYLLDERKTETPKFERAELDCTQCHIAAGTRGVPGVLLRSISPTSTGTQATNTKSFVTDQESAIANRWGGWYVTGRFDSSRLTSMANAVMVKSEEEHDSATEAKLSPVALEFDKAQYLSANSDVVAHLVLAHQTQAHNLITLTNYRTRIALFNYAKEGQKEGMELPESIRIQYERPAEQLLRYLLFANEAPLVGLGLEANTSAEFAKDFASRGPRDKKGKSLRDFDLKEHVFRYPCSYLIYTESFDAIPEPAKGYLYHRLFQVLSGEDQSADFVGIAPVARRAALEILLATKSGLPDEWQIFARTNRLPILTRSLHLSRSKAKTLTLY